MVKERKQTKVTKCKRNSEVSNTTEIAECQPIHTRKNLGRVSKIHDLFNLNAGITDKASKKLDTDINTSDHSIKAPLILCKRESKTDWFLPINKKEVEKLLKQMNKVFSHGNENTESRQITDHGNTSVPNDKVISSRTYKRKEKQVTIAPLNVRSEEFLKNNLRIGYDDKALTTEASDSKTSTKKRKQTTIGPLDKRRKVENPVADVLQEIQKENSQLHIPQTDNNKPATPLLYLKSICQKQNNSFFQTKEVKRKMTENMIPQINKSIKFETPVHTANRTKKLKDSKSSICIRQSTPFLLAKHKHTSNDYVRTVTHPETPICTPILNNSKTSLLTLRTGSKIQPITRSKIKPTSNVKGTNTNNRSKKSSSKKRQCSTLASTSHKAVKKFSSFLQKKKQITSSHIASRTIRHPFLSITKLNKIFSAENLNDTTNENNEETRKLSTKSITGNKFAKETRRSLSTKVKSLKGQKTRKLRKKVQLKQVEGKNKTVKQRNKRKNKEVVKKLDPKEQSVIDINHSLTQDTGNTKFNGNSAAIYLNLNNNIAEDTASSKRNTQTKAKEDGTSEIETFARICDEILPSINENNHQNDKVLTDQKLNSDSKMCVHCQQINRSEDMKNKQNKFRDSLKEGEDKRSQSIITTFCTFHYALPKTLSYLCNSFNQIFQKKG